MAEVTCPPGMTITGDGAQIMEPYSGRVVLERILPESLVGGIPGNEVAAVAREELLNDDQWSLMVPAACVARPRDPPWGRAFVLLQEDIATATFSSPQPISCTAYGWRLRHPASAGNVVRFVPEVLATLRCARLVAGLGAIWRFSRRDGHELLARVDDVVMPIVRRTFDDPTALEWIRGAFYTAAIKFGIGIWGYTRMAGRPVNFGLIALSTSFTRLYDDLIDHHPDDGLDSRFEELLNGGRPVPESDLERLMQHLFLAIEAAVAPRRTDPFYADVAGVHAWQHRSRRQRDGAAVTVAELTRITRGKGAWGIRVLYTLGHTGISAGERGLIEQIGVVGQMLDDQYDLPADTMYGITTPATLHSVSAREIGREVAGLASRLRGAFGHREARPFCGLLFLYLAGLTVRRRTIRRRPPPVSTTPWWILVRPTRQVIPARADQLLSSWWAGRLR